MSRPLLILYGSETGTAQDVAENLGRQARRRHFNTRVIAMDEYDKSLLLDEKLVIFVCSTTGQGEEPSNMKKFWKFLLRKNLPNDILSDLDCAVFGLGDSSYRKFNFPAKKLYKRLLHLGANMIAPRGDADDQHYMGLDGALLPWSKDLWQVVMDKYPATEAPIADDVLLPPSFHLEFLTDSGEPKKPKTLPGEFDLVIKENKRITAQDHFQDVRHIELECDDPSFRYDPGDIAVITPQNLEADVNLFFELMEWTDHANKIVRIVPSGKDHMLPTHWPEVMVFRDLFVYCLDIFGVPRRSFFEMLAYFTTNDDHTERLREFAAPEGQEDMWSYAARPRRTIAEVLFDFKPFNIPFDYMLDLFPQLQPRSFSIASSLKLHPSKMELCVAIVKYKTKMRKIRRGIMTKWLSTLVPGDVISRVRIAKGTMNLPPSTDIPLIAIGPGTGVAPMRSFIEERVANGAKENVLFFGCRHKEKDFFYNEEWDKYKEKGQLEYVAAFSRDQEQKIYVQDRIRQKSALLWDLIENKQAKIVLSGSLEKMPADVAYALKQVFMKEGGLDAEETENYFTMMNKTGQYQEECWS